MCIENKWSKYPLLCRIDDMNDERWIPTDKVQFIQCLFISNILSFFLCLCQSSIWDFNGIKRIFINNGRCRLLCSFLEGNTPMTTIELDSSPVFDFSELLIPRYFVRSSIALFTFSFMLRSPLWVLNVTSLSDRECVVSNTLSSSVYCLHLQGYNMVQIFSQCIVRRIRHQISIISDTLVAAIHWCHTNSDE